MRLHLESIKGHMPAIWCSGGRGFGRLAARYLTCGILALLLSAPLIRDSLAMDGLSVQSLKETRERALVMQHWETSCAAAAIATVLTYAFHDPVSERYAAAKMLEKTQAAKVRSRGGFSLLDMKRFVEGHGYSASAYGFLSFEDLKLFRAPIVPISVHGYNHYVVVNTVTDTEVLLADPSFGNRSMSIERFKQDWLNGLAFVVKPRSRKP